MVLNNVYIEVYLTHLSSHPITDTEVKSLNKRASGQAFEVIFKSPVDLFPERQKVLVLPPQKKPSLGDLQRRLQAAEERRKVRSHRIRL